MYAHIHLPCVLIIFLKWSTRDKFHELDGSSLVSDLDNIVRKEEANTIYILERLNVIT